MNRYRKWIQVEGRWREVPRQPWDVIETDELAWWAHCRDTGAQPTHEGPEPPK